MHEGGVDRDGECHGDNNGSDSDSDRGGCFTLCIICVFCDIHMEIKANMSSMRHVYEFHFVARFLYLCPE